MKQVLPPLKMRPLTDEAEPWVVVRFTHFRDGLTHMFYSAVNEMSGNRLSAFDNDPPGINDPKAWVQTVLRDIHAKASNVEMIGTIKPARPKPKHS